MINFRQIFNPSYNYIGMFIIAILILWILVNNKNLYESLKQIGTISLISGIITLFLAIIINFIINQLLPHQYKIFIQVISQNVFKSATTSSLITIGVGMLLLLITKIWKKQSSSQLRITS